MAGDVVIVAGFGFRSVATSRSLADALTQANGRGSAMVLATADDKANAACLLALAQALGLPIIAVDAATLTRQETMTRSRASLSARGIGSLAEAAALAAAGPGARLLASRSVSNDGAATCALAEGNGS